MSNNLGNYTKARQNQNIYLGVPKEPKQVLVQNWITATGRIKERSIKVPIMPKELAAQIAELRPAANEAASEATKANDKEATTPKRQTQVKLGSQLDAMDKHVSDLASRSKAQSKT